MTSIEQDILKCIWQNPSAGQRLLSDLSGFSLGLINKSIKSLTSQEFLDENSQLTVKAKDEIKNKAPKRAIILAAGFGMRMVPVNLERPKALLEVRGEILIERMIRHLHEVGVNEIYIVVGFLKESFDYLVDKYGVKLIVNDLYGSKNNLHSLTLAANYLENVYVIPCDIWCRENPFSHCELHSWYMVSEEACKGSSVRVNRKMELTSASSVSGGNQMIGISYLVGEVASELKRRLLSFDQKSQYESSFWEEALFDNSRIAIPAKLVRSADFFEINTYEQLRNFDENSNHLKTDAIDVIANCFKVAPRQIVDICVLKKGMTNRSFLFSCKGKKYIMRIPGEGTSLLIDRKNEAAVYQAVSGKGVCDDVVYINPETGYKITSFLEGVRVCDPVNDDDLLQCMDKLRYFHELKISVDHEFDIFGQIAYYESLWNGAPSVFRDYAETKRNVLSLKSFVEEHAGEKVLTHIDAIPDNFLFSKGSSGETIVSLIDWEYAGMQDPHVDLAMFCIYSFYDKEQTDHLLNIYFQGNCPDVVRVKVYAYMAVCGFLWSNWCEYKRSLGVEFGEYHLRQYRYAKDFFKLVVKERELLNI
ncbi:MULTISPECIES: phosphotransferase [unclassified Fibrobacter]|uniref:phosphotransferase n=1 Tax=unclassified Fibrobacter TaxID=2634177 RepID=UPI000D6DBD4A|nr:MULTISPECIES: phosphotransferase [unclassified Fibrobacter]PWJ64033.1 CTP:phosphocholine cytidylyltransferase-like protein [Fibrobacter sp. UWR4]PZW69230.1 CTP:phosphocholine cytidylyltransferase-like protein [Fibrobacter sp. UWR1]